MADVSIPVATNLQDSGSSRADTTNGNGGNGHNRFLEEALIANKREGQKLAVKARIIALLVIAAFVVYLDPSVNVLYYEALIFAFILNGYAQLRIGRVGRSKPELLLMYLDIILMGIVLLVPNPFDDEVWSASMQYKYGGFPYYYVLLAGAALSYSWRTMFAVFWATVIVWSGGYFWAVSQPPILPEIDAGIQAMLADYPHIAEQMEINGVPVKIRVQEILVFGIVAGILALNNWRTNRLLVRLANAARERANLARYFAPTMVDHLAGMDQPLGEVRSQPVVVMFVDIVGFTKMAEQMAPERVIALLRAFHSLMEKCVFEHHGTLDKFLGDGLMVTFGTPESGPRDARNALDCSLAMQKAIRAWNTERVGQNLPEVRLSVGLHGGNVVLGDIGSARRLEYTVLGDVVNVSSRLEVLSREINAVIVASNRVVADAGGDDVARTLGLLPAGPQYLRGREEPVEVWTLKRD
jgi:adenylate cyclase